MAKFFKGKLNLPNIRDIERKLKADIKKDVATNIQKELEAITHPLDTKFQFETIESEKDGDVNYNVLPIRENIERTTATGGTVDSWVLFNTLDLGSENAARVLLPDDFINQTYPNSTVTRGADYDREDIIVLFNQPFDQSMEPRNWSKLLRERYEVSRTKYIRTLVTKAAKKALGI